MLGNLLFKLRIETFAQLASLRIELPLRVPAKRNLALNGDASGAVSEFDSCTRRPHGGV